MATAFLMYLTPETISQMQPMKKWRFLDVRGWAFAGPTHLASGLPAQTGWRYATMSWSPDTGLPLKTSVMAWTMIAMD
jgi:hypothetical protein